MWRPASVGSTIYNKAGEVPLQSDDQVSRVSWTTRIATIVLTGNNTIEVQSGDVVGYYHPSDAHYRLITRGTDGYILYQFSGSHESVDLNNNMENNNEQQPVIQFTIGKCTLSYVVKPNDISLFNNYMIVLKNFILLFKVRSFKEFCVGRSKSNSVLYFHK